MGGGAMRTVAKAAALGGYRSPAFVVGAARRAPQPSAAALATVDGGTSVPVLSASDRTPQIEVSLQRPAWELDDWDFSSWSPAEEEYATVASSVEPAPRLVFGPLPTLEEAQEAASDLSDALEKVHCSSSSGSNFRVGFSGHQDSVSNGASAIIPSMPRQVVQAFSLLQGNPEAREVVASLASSKAVWDAVMSNEKVKEFCNSHHFIVPDSESSVHTEDFGTGGEHANWSSGSCESSTAESSTISGFADFIYNIKVKVEEMADNISNFLQDLLGTSSSTSTKTTGIPDIAMGSFFTLAVGTILVILFKRGA